MIMIKPGAYIAGLGPGMLVALMAADSLYRRFGADCKVTTEGGTLILETTNLHELGDPLKLSVELRTALGAEFEVTLGEGYIQIQHAGYKDAGVNANR